MKNFIIRFLGGVPKHEREEEVRDAERRLRDSENEFDSQLRDRDSKILQKDAELVALRSKTKRTLPVVDITFSDPAPTNEKEFAEYCREWTLFADNFLDRKCRHLIFLAREELDWSGMPSSSHPDSLPDGMSREAYDWMMRGTSNALKMLLDYSAEMRSAHLRLTTPNE